MKNIDPDPVIDAVEYDSDYRQELCEQADFWGMDSLTEIEQCIVDEEWISPKKS